VFIAFRLKPGRDDDLIAWIQNTGEGDRSYHIRQMIRQGLWQTPASSHTTVKLEPRKVGNAIQTVSERNLEAALDTWL
jgi:hypothetical protein